MLLQRLAVLAFFAVFTAACGGGGDESTTPIESDATTTSAADVTTTTEAATTTKEPTPTTTTETTTTTEVEETTTTVAEVVSDTAGADTDDAVVIAYCTAMDDVDAFIDGDFPAEDDLAAAIDEQQENIRSIVVPPDTTIDSAHEQFTGALLEFYEEFEANDYDISDSRIEEIFSGLNLRVAEGIIEQYRENNCDGFVGDDEPEEIVSASFDFSVGQCIDEVGANFEDRQCNEPHDYQVYSIFEYSGDDAFPGAIEVEAKADSYCVEQFQGFVGEPFSTSIYYATTLRPTSGSWLIGDREIVCLAQAESGKLDQDLEGIGE